jgi:hypothetical protein
MEALGHENRHFSALHMPHPTVGLSGLRPVIESFDRRDACFDPNIE